MLLSKHFLFYKVKRLYIIIGLISFVTTLKAAPVDSITAKTVASNFYAREYNVKSLSLSLAYTEKSSTGEVEYYIFNVYPDNGFIIISADDAAYPIIGYSSEGYFPNSQLISPDFAFWMRHYKKQIASIRLNSIKASAAIQTEWTAYKNNLPLKSDRKITSSVGPLMNTTWAQAPYYNSTCPNGDVAGCVATAMGQIMKYWAYPPHGVDSNSYTDNPYGVLTAYFDTTHYNWAAMPSNITKTNRPVATLMYDCGISVEMQYSPSSSGSYMIVGDNPICTQSALVKYFGYNGSSIQGLYMANYSNADWVALLENELNNKRPFQYAGTGDSGSHSWVCDGYNANGDFHMNWGWGGYEDGYYNLMALNPDNLPLSSDEEALIGIQPAPAVADFSANRLIIRAGDTVTFKDNSFGPVPIINWQWSFPGALNTSSKAQNPIAIYGTPGIYDVTETATSSQGSGTSTHDSYIIVLDNNPVNVYPTLSNGTFTVQLHDASLANNNIEFSLYDILGQKIYATTLVQYITQVTISVPHGMYFFRAFDAAGKPVSTGKLVIK